MSFRKILNEKVKKAFIEAGFDEKYAIVTVSNRPDLCQYQCNGCMAAAKEYRMKPLDIASKVIEFLAGDEAFEKAEVCPPGFLNLTVKDEFLTDYITKMSKDKAFLYRGENTGVSVIDYGGANVAKSLHVGHLRSAIIGESIKRILRFTGKTVYGDVHLGDWGLQMGMVICGIIEQFGLENLQTEEDRLKNITIKVLETTYPAKSQEAKENEDVMAECKRITFELQKGEGIYFDIWKTVLEVSKNDLKKNYGRLGVEFDLWKGESDVRDIMPEMIEKLKSDGYAYMDDGALIIDVTNETDNPPIPPFIVVKSDGSVLYSTTDLATIIEREESLNPDEIIYVVDNRQGGHFKQLFRTVEVTKTAKESLKLFHAGFGTMNGKDGKPFKTRQGGVMKLEDLINTIVEGAYEKIAAAVSNEIGEDEKREIAEIVGIGALKFGDLLNHRSKDYVFDIDKFCSFEGKTGPYVQYSAVRIKSILSKAESTEGVILPPEGDVQRDLFIMLTEFPYAVEGAASDYAPNVLIEYIYNLSVILNKYYHEYKVLSEADEEKRRSRIATLKLTLDLITKLLGLVGIDIPERM
ncbi:MAG: arginine--tRNA ligase [Clostridia bacterium]|nr:arginine--tRNA ligase [Clostridia bacterium]